MSETPVEIVAVKAVKAHPNADRLEIVIVLGTQFLAPVGDFLPGQLCAYFPPDILIPPEVAWELGVHNYLKHAVYPGRTAEETYEVGALTVKGTDKTQCRVGAIRLRGQPSFGFGLPLFAQGMPFLNAEDRQIGADISHVFSAVKYQPPVKCRASNAMPADPNFHKYTDIQHYYRYADAVEGGTPVRITEKIHGTNSRVGVVDGTLMCGSHNMRVARESGVHPALYWMPLTPSMVEMLNFIAMGRFSVIVFGEIYGPQVQSMDYGLTASTFRVFDISVDSQYMDWCDVKSMCDLYDINTVPVLYEGPFHRKLIDQYISGPTRLATPDNIRCDFKGREGIVITPQEETYSTALGGRLILKAVSPDYLAET